MPGEVIIFRSPVVCSGGPTIVRQSCNQSQPGRTPPNNGDQTSTDPFLEAAMRHALIGLLMTAATIVATPADAAVNVSIGINVPAYPSLVRVPNYPVYYAPSLQANYFFYDGLYWVYGADGIWYESPWYNGP